MRTWMFSFVLAVMAVVPGMAEESAYDGVLSHYETIREALVMDSFEGVTGEAEAIGAIVAQLGGDLSAETAGVPAASVGKVDELLPELQAAAADLGEAGDLASAREAFYAVSMPLVRYHALVGDETREVAYCSMARKSWLQPAGQDIGNPYYGQSMDTCGQIVSE